ncbi:MAG: TIGR03560 family F420-dependent LLM class oxidoreductase [Actinomycetota bacterium]
MSAEPPPVIRLPADALVVLAGPSGAGKSTWAARWFRPSQVVSSDDLRGVVGEHEHDLAASTDAFAVLDLVVERRLARGLLTVVDTLGMDRNRHAAWLDAAARHGRSTHLVVFDDDPKAYRKRNNARPSPVPSKVLTAQLATWDEVRPTLGDPFEAVHAAGPAAVAPKALLATGAGSAAEGNTAAAPPTMRFGLLISAFDWPGGNEATAADLARIVGDAERAGFDSVWLMDHMIQIPQVGREWDPMLEPYTTLGFLAAHTQRIELGVLVSCVTHRSIGRLAKIVSTLDVLSGGRAWCGLGLGWFEREHAAYGIHFPPVGERYDLLEDALEALPLYWGAGAPAYEGRRFSTPEALSYPRPLQDKIPILVGGSGERRTLRLAARHADACNLFGEPEVVARKVSILHEHCEAEGRDPAEVAVTQLSSVLSAPTVDALRSRIDEIRPANVSPEAFAERTMAGVAGWHVDRFGALADAGVQTAIVSLADVGHPDAVGDFASVIDALRA